MHRAAVTPELFLSAGEIRIAFVLYKHIGGYLSTENASMKLGSEALATNYSVIVNSPVITAAINKDSNKVYLSDPVIFTIRHLQVISWLFEALSPGRLLFALMFRFGFFRCFDVLSVTLLKEALWCIRDRFSLWENGKMFEETPSRVI